MSEFPSVVALIEQRVKASVDAGTAKENKIGQRSQGEKYSLSLAGEFFVAAELQRHQIHASVSYGTAKNADVYAFAPGSNRYVKVEVKSTWKGTAKWLTGPDSIKEAMISPDTFWVLVMIPLPHERGAHPEFHVFTSKELIGLLREGNREYKEKYLAKHNRPFDDTRGVNGISAARVEQAGGRDQWGKIHERLWGLTDRTVNHSST